MYFFQDLEKLSKPLYNRLKNPKPWTEEHIKIVKLIKEKLRPFPVLVSLIHMLFNS